MRDASFIFVWVGSRTLSRPLRRDWRAVEIEGGLGVRHPPVRFRRASGMSRCRSPCTADRLTLRSFLTCPVWMERWSEVNASTAALVRGHGISTGAAKGRTGDYGRARSDTAPLRACREDRDLFIAAARPVLAFDRWGPRGGWPRSTALRRRRCCRTTARSTAPRATIRFQGCGARTCPISLGSFRRGQPKMTQRRRFG